jgi:hypothetical protein
LLKILIFFAALELALFVALLEAHRRFPWLIMSKDWLPKLGAESIDKFMSQSFSQTLGWEPRTNTTGHDGIRGGDVKFHINDVGARLNPGFEEKVPSISVFGDSFAFCRLVNDFQTWPHYLSKELSQNIENFGVGNYGLDQAVLRFKEKLPEMTSNKVILCIVPETIVRIQCRWKHYFEYGNILAFKPVYRLAKTTLVLEPNPIQGRQDLTNLAKVAKTLRKKDRFFVEKFSKETLTFPFTISVLKNARRNIPLLFHILTGGEVGWQRAFDIILRGNKRVVEQLYEEKKSQNLLTALIKHFTEVAKSNCKVPIIVVIPQWHDLAFAKGGSLYYREVFENACRDDALFIDCADFMIRESLTDLFVKGQLGPHISARGNQLIAKEVAKLLG